ncbi:MAG: leucine-rich repeat domain-containing protein, partial [Bacteroidales bacterium]
EAGSSSPLSQNPTYKITVNKSITIIAKFIATYTISISSNPATSVTIKGAGEYDVNTKVKVTASSNVPSLINFAGWYDEGNNTQLSTQTEYEVIVTKNIKLIAQFNISGTYIPDPNFQKYLLDNALVTLVFTDNDKNYYNATSKGVNFTFMDISSKSIADIRGIELFTNLTKFVCEISNLTNVDLSKNTKLTSLHLRWSHLTSLDVSKNTALTTLYCDHNQLTSLDVSNCPQLKSLWCHENQLTSLDISRNPALNYLLCYTNRLTSLDARNMADVDDYNLQCGRQTTNGSTARRLNLTIKSTQQTRWNALSSNSNNTYIDVTVQ